MISLINLVIFGKPIVLFNLLLKGTKAKLFVGGNIETFILFHLLIIGTKGII